MLLSTHEAWGLVAEEANYCGVPCILSSNSGYGAWSRSVGINIVIDSTTIESIVSALDLYAQQPLSVLSGSSLRDIIVQKGRTQVAAYLRLLDQYNN